MKMRYVYMLSHRPSGIPIQDVFLSRCEARESKRMYENRDGEKYSILRFKSDKQIR